MKKVITILGAIAIASSPALSLNVFNNKTQNFQNISKPTADYSDLVVHNNIISLAIAKEYFFFKVVLSNSTYNGFPGFMNQITVPPMVIDWVVFFFQWLNNNSFKTRYFPDLNKFTYQGFFNNPVTRKNRLGRHMRFYGRRFGNHRRNNAFNAYRMITRSQQNHYLDNFGETVENTYNQDAKTGKVAGIVLNFGFKYDGSYSVVKPTFNVIMNQ